MKLFFKYRLLIVVILMIIAVGLYLKFGIFDNPNIERVVKALPFIAIAVVGMFPAPEKYRGNP
jgi:hypothetical protein